MFPEWSSVGACSFGRVPVTFYIVVELDFCVQSGGDVHRGAFLYPSHGTHRFPYGARCSRSNNQRTGEEAPAEELVPNVRAQTIISLLFIQPKSTELCTVALLHTQLGTEIHSP